MCVNSKGPDFDWNDLRSFLAVVRAGRLTVAAQQLGVDHSTLSRRITSLENALQVRLFDRLLTGYVLTEAGRSLVGEAERIEAVAIRISSDLMEAKVQMSGPVRVATPEGFGTYFLAQHLQTLAGRHPEVTLELIADPGVVSLARREADIAVTMERPDAGPLRAQKLMNYEYGLYGSEQFLREHGTGKGDLDYDGVRLIGYIHDMIPTPAHDYLSELIRGRRADLQISNIITQLSATLSGYGLCILPCFMAAQHRALRRVIPERIRFTRSYWLVTHVDVRAPARAKAIVAFLQDIVRENRSLFQPSAATQPDKDETDW
ncbi:HTH-type transcriptional regulator DmlR [Methylobacterium brachiatum]|uniref:LysR family transcriptional regulator n=1 Tax=Methylobacterium sp. J-077 TaxID=2836656 RepID=UPI00137ED143|nr:LysR family transcriptional regulator [Methylobacterium sp. J-077]MCJ2121184.1 LysR family transcriptional regulator [Methylobacterium sp. J-077]CAA2158831.1 HTH-type transcriptional regulator DmlR [Methylobacterium brachiatum]